MFIEENKHDNLVDFKIIANKTNVGTVKNIINAFTYVKGDFYITSGADDFWQIILWLQDLFRNFRKNLRMFGCAVRWKMYLKI